jgi:hypothetical protein
MLRHSLNGIIITGSAPRQETTTGCPASATKSQSRSKLLVFSLYENFLTTDITNVTGTIRAISVIRG